MYKCVELNVSTRTLDMGESVLIVVVSVMGIVLMTFAFLVILYCLFCFPTARMMRDMSLLVDPVDANSVAGVFGSTVDGTGKSTLQTLINVGRVMNSTSNTKLKSQVRSSFVVMLGLYFCFGLTLECFLFLCFHFF